PISRCRSSLSPSGRSTGINLIYFIVGKFIPIRADTLGAARLTGHSSQEPQILITELQTVPNNGLKCQGAGVGPISIEFIEGDAIILRDWIRRLKKFVLRISIYVTHLSHDFQTIH